MQFVKRSFPGPYPEPHTHPMGGRWPPDGDAQPAAPAEQSGVGLSYQVGWDFGPYVQHLGACPRMWNDLTEFLRCDVPFSAGNVHPHTGLLLFALVINQRPLVVVETGTFYGYSTWFLAQALDWWGDPGSKVYSIDPDHGRVAECVRNHPRVQLVPGTGGDVVPHLGAVHFAFLDSYKRAALLEFGYVAPLIPAGGVVVLHDTQLLNTGLATWEHLRRAPGWDSMLFAGTPSADDPHHFWGNADDRGLMVMRKREANPFLEVADHGTHSAGLGSKLIGAGDD